MLKVGYITKRLKMISKRQRIHVCNIVFSDGVFSGTKAVRNLKTLQSDIIYCSLIFCNSSGLWTYFFCQRQLTRDDTLNQSSFRDVDDWGKLLVSFGVYHSSMSDLYCCSAGAIECLLTTVMSGAVFIDH